MAATRSDPPTLRRLGPGDEPQLWSLRARALSESPRAFGRHPDEHPDLTTFRSVQAARWEDPDQRALGAFAADTLVAMAYVVRSSGLKVRHRASLYGFYVAPEARRRGVGRALLRAAVDEAADLGAELLELTVTEGNEAALTLYRSEGFTPWGVQPRALRVDGEDLGEVWMTRPVGTSGPQPR